VQRLQLKKRLADLGHSTDTKKLDRVPSSIKKQVKRVMNLRTRPNKKPKLVLKRKTKKSKNYQRSLWLVILTKDVELMIETLAVLSKTNVLASLALR
jgi:hypothetical protein